MILIEMNSLLTAYNIACGAFFVSVFTLIIAAWALFSILKQKHHKEKSLYDGVGRIPGCYQETSTDETSEKGCNISSDTQQPSKIIISVDDNIGEGKRSATKGDFDAHSTPTEETLQAPMATEQESEQTSTISDLVNRDFLYATAVDEGDNKTFICVENKPSKGETIFKFIKIQEGKCEFEVYEGAYSLVLKESEYLKGACTLNKVGNSKISTTKRGMAELNGDGKWCVKEQAKVKFE